MVKKKSKTLIDGSKIIVEGLVRAGADIFIGYPITPSNLFYRYAQNRFPTFHAAPDEISVLQWMSGAATTGRLPVTATAFPGLALMVESLNMAFAMELPMVIVVTQRLGPSTGSATTGAQGDLGLITGIVPGFDVPVFCPSSFEDCWELPARALQTAVELRTPVILLTSKEMVMTSRSFDLSALPRIDPVIPEIKGLHIPYQSYRAGEDLIAPLLSVVNEQHQVRINSSTHDLDGLIAKNEESLNVTRRLKTKINSRSEKLCYYEFDGAKTGKKLIVTYGVSSFAARDALKELRERGEDASLLVMKTLIPISAELIEIIESFRQVLFVEENINGQLAELIYGKLKKENRRQLNKLGEQISPTEIVNELV